MTKMIALAAVLSTLSLAHAADLPTFNLTAKDGIFEPTEIVVPANQKIQLIVKNEGREAEEFESDSLKREKVIPPGKTVTINLGPLKPGEYKFIGEFHAKTAHGKVVAK